jgi:hypothetical protein
VLQSASWWARSAISKSEVSYEESDIFTVTKKTSSWNISEDTCILGLQRIRDLKGYILWNVWCSHSGADGDPKLQENDAMSNSKELSTFRGSTLSPIWASRKFLWPCIIVYQYSETNVMHILFSLLRIKGLHMFRAPCSSEGGATQTAIGIFRVCYVS